MYSSQKGVFKPIKNTRVLIGGKIQYVPSVYKLQASDFHRQPIDEEEKMHDDDDDGGISASMQKMNLQPHVQPQVQVQQIMKSSPGFTHPMNPMSQLKYKKQLSVEDEIEKHFAFGGVKKVKGGAIKII
jgi:hypothetical protein